MSIFSPLLNHGPAILSNLIQVVVLHLVEPVVSGKMHGLKSQKNKKYSWVISMVVSP